MIDQLKEENGNIRYNMETTTQRLDRLSNMRAMIKERTDKMLMLTTKNDPEKVKIQLEENAEKVKVVLENSRTNYERELDEQKFWGNRPKTEFISKKGITEKADISNHKIEYAFKLDKEIKLDNQTEKIHKEKV